MSKFFSLYCKDWLNSLVYGDSCRASFILFHPCTCAWPLRSRSRASHNVLLNAFNVITYSIQLPFPESKLHTLCSLKMAVALVGGIRAPLGTLSSLKYISYFSQKIRFELSCKLTVCMMCQTLFSGKNKKNVIILSSGEFAQRVVKIKISDSIILFSGSRCENIGADVAKLTI